MLISPKTPRDDAVCDRRGEKKDEPTSGRQEERLGEAGGGGVRPLFQNGRR